MSQPNNDARTQAANTIRALAIDAVNQANSGHPGAPLGLADIATILFGEVMNYDPTAPDWLGRDRFVLSNGHASMLIYSLLHLTGHDLSLEEIKNFRQMGSKTPGHPEYGMTPGVETTTGPLGQGFANAVGLALGQRMADARFPGKEGFKPFANYTYGILGDGCAMEGITSEAASLAGHLGLGELIFFFDDNKITIDGSTDIAFTENVEARYQAYGWHTLRIDGHDYDAILDAVEQAKKDPRPSLILARTHIGFGSPNRVDTPKAHGAPLGEEEGGLTKKALSWEHPPFTVPEGATNYFKAQADKGKAAHQEWKAQLESWFGSDTQSADTFKASFEKRSLNYSEILKAMDGAKGATRGLSGKALNAIAAQFPALIGGSADLAGSNKSDINESPAVQIDSFAGRNIHFGVREHAMAAITNGLALHGGFVPFGATFLAFSDYMRPSLRLSALMKIRALQVFTHDSIGLGEDGPTHQPVEHLWALRMIPGYTVWRPADALETTMSWAYSVNEGPEGPHALVFTRQGTAVLSRPDSFVPEDVWKGGYAVTEAADAKVTIIGTGSEVGLAVDAAELLKEKGISARVVSMPSVDKFLEQDSAYQDKVLPAGQLLVAVEAGSAHPWRSVVGRDGMVFGLNSFGESAPYEEVYAHFGLTKENIATKVAERLS